MALRLVLENAGKDVQLVRARGAIDLVTAPQWEDLIRRAIRQRTSTVIVDVGQLEHVSARGLELLLALAANQSLLGGRLIVAGARGAIHRAARLVGLWELAVEAPSVRAALLKAQQHRTASESGRRFLKEARSPSKRLAREAGEA